MEPERIPAVDGCDIPESFCVTSGHDFNGCHGCLAGGPLLMRGANHATRGVLLPLPLPPRVCLCRNCRVVLVIALIVQLEMTTSACRTKTANTSLRSLCDAETSLMCPPPTHVCHPLLAITLVVALLPQPSSPTLNTPDNPPIRYHVPECCSEISANATHRPVAASQGWELVVRPLVLNAGHIVTLMYSRYLAPLFLVV